MRNRKHFLLTPPRPGIEALNPMPEALSPNRDAEWLKIHLNSLESLMQAQLRVPGGSPEDDGRAGVH